MSDDVRTCLRKGCPVVLNGAHGNARYCSDACKSQSWRDRTGYRVLPASNVCQTRKSRRSGSSGAQIAYLKALRVLAAHFESEGMHPPYAREKARGVLRPALPDKQRAKLDASLGANG